MKNAKVIVEIRSGEYYSSHHREEIIATLLGSCIAVCLFDESAGVGGMNHFMLPYSHPGDPEGKQNDARYGNQAMELLTKDVLMAGGRLGKLQAKVFGGGEMIRSDQFNVAKANVEFAIEYLQQRGIPVMAMDVGGKYGRKIFFQLKDFQVFVKKSKTLPKEEWFKG